MTLVTTLDNDTPDAEALGVSSFVAKIDGSNRLEINMVKPVEIDGFNLHTHNRICYTMGGRNEITKFPRSIREKPPKESAWEAFLFPYCEQGLTLRLVAFHSLVKPFAEVVADYPRHDGEKERNYKIFHRLYTSFPCQDGGGNEQSIAYSDAKRKCMHRRKNR